MASTSEHISGPQEPNPTIYLQRYQGATALIGVGAEVYPMK